jgi:tetratricopeptide (TPR) repeat protein
MRLRPCLVCLLVGLSSLRGYTRSYNRNLEKEKAIWQELQGIAPGSVETFKAATAALDKGDYQQAVSLYEEVSKAAPEFDAVLRRLGTSLVYSGKTQEGLAQLNKAVQKKRSPENLICLSELLAYPAKGKEGSSADRQLALTLAKEANERYEGSDDPSYPSLVGGLALSLHQDEDFRDAAKKLRKQYPNEMVTHYFSGIEAAMEEDWIRSENELKEAENLGLPHEEVERLLESGIHSKATIWRYSYYSGYLVAAWAGGLVLLFLLGKLLSDLTLHSIAKSNPNLSASNAERSLRRCYRALITIAALYYYISIPVVIFLVIAIAGSITYGFFMLGRIPIKLVAILVIGSVVTVYQMIRSLFIRIKPEDPGRSLRHDEAPGLWALTREVAQDLGTRPIDEIRVTPGTELAVYEKGSFKERSLDQARRLLILGIGLLNGFKQVPFRTVLAHEYGHFSHRDTAGGEVALRVNSDMMKFAHAMIFSGQAVWWNMGFRFLRVYDFIFRRISHGATRLQEVLADRIAALRYGASNFEEGLEHVIRRHIEFDHSVDKEINEAVRVRRTIRNLYELAPVEEKILADEINKALNRQTSEDDTHPSPADRFRLVGQVTSKNDSAGEGMVWDLFADRETLTKEMSSLVNSQVKASVALS